MFKSHDPFLSIYIFIPNTVFSIIIPDFVIPTILSVIAIHVPMLHFCHSHDIICYCNSCTNASFLSIYIFIPNIVLQLSSPILSFPRYSLTSYLRQGISHVCLTISPKGELVLYKNKGQRVAFKPKGRPTQEERKVLDCSKQMCVELSKLKHEMCFEESTKMLTALFISSNQMLRHVHMFPET